MALNNAVSASFLAVSLTFSFLSPFCTSQPTYPSANAGPGGGTEGGRMYLVAPTLQDCPRGATGTDCNTLSYYARAYTSRLSNVVFYFLPGTHNLTWTWTVILSRNVSLLGGKDFEERDKTSGGMALIVGQERFFTGIYM